MTESPTTPEPRSEDRPLRWRGSLALAALGPLGWLALRGLAARPDLVETYYSNGIFVAVRGQYLKGHGEIRPVLQAMVDSGIQMRLELIELIQHGEIALERARCTIEGSDAEPNSSTVVLKRGSDAQWRILIDDPWLG